MGDVHPDDPMLGRVIDDQGRCIHHGGKDDIVCFRYPDEDWTFWACHECHDELHGPATRAWAKDEQNELAIQCGICRSILGIKFYRERQRNGDHSCPHCKAPWNPAYQNERGADALFANH